MKQGIKALGFLVGLLLTTWMATAADFSAWQKRSTVTAIRPEANVYASLPVLIKLGTNIAGFDYTEVKAGGADLRFSDSAGSDLSYEIDTWDTNGLSTIWVKVPTFTYLTEINVYWKNPAANAPAVTNNEAVWNAYNAVYHFNDTISNGSPVNDSTAGQRDGLQHAVTVHPEGAIGQAVHSAGGQTIALPGAIQGTNEYARRSFWVRREAATSWGMLMYGAGTNDASSSSMGLGWPDGLHLFGNPMHNGGTDANDPGVLASNTWEYCVLESYYLHYDVTNIWVANRLYRNGEMVDWVNVRPPIAGVPDTVYLFGTNAAGGTGAVPAAMDDLRTFTSSQLTGTQWPYRLEYLMVASNATIFNYGAVVDNNSTIIPSGDTWATWRSDNNDYAMADLATLAPSWMLADGLGSYSYPYGSYDLYYGWVEGLAPLGYGDTGIVTGLIFGPTTTNRYTTHYFRNTFVVSTPAAVTGLLASFIADDGAVIYLNGTRVHTTTNLPVPAAYSTLALSTAVEPYVPKQFTINPNLLLAGTNLIAVEVHQSAPDSSDLYWNMSLTIVNYTTTNELGVSGPQPDTSVSWTAFNDLSWSSDQLLGNITRVSWVDDAEHDLGGALLKFSDGTPSPVTMTCGAGAAAVAGLWATTNQGTPNAGTPGYIYFDGKIDMDRTVFVTNDQVGTILLEGMDPARMYKVVLLGNRGDPSYTARTTVVTLSDADSFINASSPGAIVSGAQTQTTTIVTGTNDGGQVFIYTDIMSGSDGEILLTCNGNPGNTWYLNAIALELLPLGGITDTDGDGIDDSWEQANFGGLGQSATGDFDNDGSNNYNEYYAGTDPNTAGSRLELSNLTQMTGNQMVLMWSSVTGKTYSILQCTNLASPFGTLASGIGATAPINVYTANAASTRGYVRIKVE